MMIFNINITKKYTNAKLEYMFSDLRAENYSMYDTWFKNKFNMSAKDIFKEHYNNFKPTLNQIEKFDVSSLKSSAYSANLAESRPGTSASQSKSIRVIFGPSSSPK